MRNSSGNELYTLRGMLISIISRPRSLRVSTISNVTTMRTGLWGSVVSSSTRSTVPTDVNTMRTPFTILHVVWIFFPTWWCLSS